MSAPPTLRVRLLGGFGVWVGDRAVADGVWRRKRAADLVKLLALEPGHRLHREQALETLWPGLDPEDAANNLRVALHAARRALATASAPELPILGRDGDVLVLAPAGRVATDVAAFEEAVAAAWRTDDPAAYRAAAAAYAGDLLPEDAYEDWAEGRRVTLRTSHLTLLTRLARVHEERGEPGPAIEAWQRVLAAEPAQEEAHAALMRLYAASGLRRRALTQYDRLVAVLAADLDAAPEGSTRELAAAIRADRLPRLAQTAPTRPEPATEKPVVASTLPTPLGDLIGRERELAELRRLLDTARLVTLTGPGGIGKTSLALAVAREAAAAFPDGAHFVDLAPIRDPALVLPAVARVLDVREADGETLAPTLAAHLRDKRLLLVLDNFEQVVEAAPVVSGLLTASPGLRAVVTSRTRLRLRGEQEYPLRPLVLPDPAHLPAAEALSQYAAVALFVQRAREVQPGFRVTNETAPAVAEICHRLDGLPLALELAAAWVKVLPLPALLARLAHPLRLLMGGSRDQPERQRTLRATIAWSHDLLEPAERALFRRLAIFVGGFSLPAAEAVVAAAGDCPEGTRPDVLAGVAALVEKSLVVEQGECVGEPRFAMLETIREFGAERLAASGEEAAVRRRHAAFFAAWAEAAEPELVGPRQGAWLDRLETEHGNLRAALRWALDPGGRPEAGGGTTEHRLPTDDGREASTAELGLRLAAALWRFWDVRGYGPEGRGWVERTLARGGLVRAELRAKALHSAGAMAWSCGDLDAAVARYEAALASWEELGRPDDAAKTLDHLGTLAILRNDYGRAARFQAAALEHFRSVGDDRGVASALQHLGSIALDRGDFAEATARFEESACLLRTAGDAHGLGVVLDYLGALALRQGDLERAAALHEEAAAICRRLGARQGIAAALINLGRVAEARADDARAEPLYEEALGIVRDLGDAWNEALALRRLAGTARRRREDARAGELLRESLLRSRHVGDRLGGAECLEALAGLLIHQGKASRAARLLGAAAALRDAIGVPLPDSARADYDRTAAAAGAALGKEPFGAAWEAGRALPLEQAAAEALALAGDSAAGGAPQDRHRDRERDQGAPAAPR